MARKYKILLALLLLLAVAGVAGTWFLEPILERSLDRYVREKISVSSGTPSYHFTYGDLEFDLTAARVSFREVRMTPDSLYKEAFRRGDTRAKALKEMRVNRISVAGIGLLNFLWDKDVAIGEIQIDSVSLNLLQTDSLRRKPLADPDKRDFSLDSIRLPGLRSLSLGRLGLKHLGLYTLRESSGDTVSSFASKGGEIRGLALTPVEGGEGSLFRFDPTGLYINLEPEQLDLRKSLYTMGFRGLEYTYNKRELHVRDLLFRPRAARDSFRLKNTHSYEIYEATATDLILEGFDLKAFLGGGDFITDRMLVDSLHMEIYRDKTKPYNTSKQVLLPQQGLKRTRFPIHIGTVGLRHSYLKYTEQTKAGAAPLVVNFSEVDGQIGFITTLPDSLQAGKPLSIDLSARLDGAIPVGVKIAMDYDTERFNVTAHTEGTSNFSSLNETVLPALGMRFKSGVLDGLRFKAAGNPSTIRGELTLRYHNLEVEIFKEHHKKKGASWVANTLLKSSNPNRRGHTVVGTVEFTREPYKGMANMVWKGVESGVVNSLNPFGKRRVTGR